MNHLTPIRENRFVFDLITPLAKKKILTPWVHFLRRFILLLLLGLGVFSNLRASHSVGLPLSRLYSLDEIGGSVGGYDIGFDPIGRLTVVQNGSYSALNDRKWVSLTKSQNSTEVIHSVLHLSSGEAYYGANGSWGRLVRSSNGFYEPQPMLPKDQPDWAKSNIYLNVFQFKQNICFLNWNGIVFWNRETKGITYIEIQGLRNAFKLAGKLYAVSADEGISRVDFSEGKAITLGLGNPLANALYYAVPYDTDHTLCATKSGNLFLFDGSKLEPWQNSLNDLEIPPASLTSICNLYEGNFAVSIAKKGLFVLNKAGRVLSAFTTIEYQNVEEVISNEPGIMWVSNNFGIQQVFYGSPVSIVDKRQGLIVNWPQIVEWQGKTIIASGGLLFDSDTNNPLETPTFEQVIAQPGENIWGIASDGETLLVSNDTGIYERVDEDTFRLVLEDFSADRLVMPSSDLCYAIRRDVIAVLRKIDGRWEEAAPRVKGFGYPSVAHAIGESAWVELGVHRVLRISYQENKLETKLIDSFPWKNTGWIHISSIGEMVVLSSPGNGRQYFDERKGVFIEEPTEWGFLNLLPYRIARLKNDSEGNIWMSHYDGIAFLRKSMSGYTVETGGYDFVRASDPIIRIMEGGNVWFNNGENLFHICRDKQYAPLKTPNPQLISMFDQLSGREFANYELNHHDQILSYKEHNVGFRFFAGSYSIRNPQYHVHISGPNFDWSVKNADSEFSLTNLYEGSYEVNCQLVSNQLPINDAIHFAFRIAAPWYRSVLAYAIYLTTGIILLILVIRWFLKKARRQNQQLSRMVKQRTQELEQTMLKLEEETRNSATLAERNRLAAELHDSVQQGLNGLMIHIDGMMLAPLNPQDQRSDLETAKKMLDFTRQEVKHALHNMRSPLLEDSDLTKTLSRISELVPSDFAEIEIIPQGKPYRIPSFHSHQLLRISQEAISNAISHGKAHKVTLKLQYKNQSLTLSIEDNGSGFDPQKRLDSTRHFGIYSLENRAKSIDAELTIDSKPGEGTRISITIPKEAFYQAKT